MDQPDPRSTVVTPGAVEKAARQFASDIRRLRERRRIPLAEVQRQTRISEGILSEFESSGLVANQLFNRVYLRSLVIAYARTIGIDQNPILDALESVLTGEYEGGVLALEELGSQGETSGEEQAVQPRALSEDPDEDSASPADADEDEEEEADVPDETVRRVANRFEFEGTQVRRTTAAGADERMHTEISTAVRDFVPPEEQKGLIVQPDRFRAIGLTSIVVIFSVSAIVLALRLSTRSGTDERAASDPPMGSENHLVTPLPPDPIPAASPIVLGDSVAVTVVALSGPLDPVRVQVDRDLRRPFWVDEGDSMTFRMTQRIVIQDLLDRLAIRVEGVPYPHDPVAGPDRIVINRDSVQSFVGSVARR